jgi:hypothetical protein
MRQRDLKDADGGAFSCWLSGLIVGLLIGLLLVGGCVNPGRATREALSQETTYDYGPERINVHGLGPQTQAFVVAEGQIRLKVDEHGREVIDLDRSLLTAYLRADPSAKDAANTAAAFAALAAAQTEMFAGTLEGIIQMVVPLIGARTQPMAAVDSEGNCATCGRKVGD